MRKICIIMMIVGGIIVAICASKNYFPWYFNIAAVALFIGMIGYMAFKQSAFDQIIDDWFNKH